MGYSNLQEYNIQYIYICYQSVHFTVRVFIKNVLSKSGKKKNYKVEVKKKKIMQSIERQNLHLEITDIFGASITP